MATLLVGAASDAGSVREQNEDAVQLADPGAPVAATHGYLAVVADGMGGHQHGEVASHLALDTLFATFYDVSGANGVSPAPVGDRLRQGFFAANEKILIQAQGDSERKGMGTTMVAAAIVGDQLTVANVGDSRAYLLRAEAATQITRDHSLVAEQVKAGVLSADEARESQQRNIVTRAIGHKPKLDVDLFEITLLPDDRILLCSDGVHGYIPPDELAELGLSRPPEQASRRLISLAIERGSTDNVTAAIVCFEPVTAAVTPQTAELVGAGRRGSFLLTVLLLIVIVALIAGAVVLYLTGFFG